MEGLNLRLADYEWLFYSELYERLEDRSSGQVPWSQTKQILISSGLQPDTIHKIVEKCGAMRDKVFSRSNFFGALKLIAAAQNGWPVEEDALYKELPLPRIQAEEEHDLMDINAEPPTQEQPHGALSSPPLKRASPRTLSHSSDDVHQSSEGEEDEAATSDGVVAWGEGGTDTEGLLGSGHKSFVMPDAANKFETSSVSSADESVDELWVMSDEQREYYTNQFLSMQPDPAGLITGPEAKQFFEKSKLQVWELSKIWQLSDVNKDGCLSLGEFCTAMHLVILRRNCPDVELPPKLPPSLTPYTQLDDPFRGGGGNVEDGGAAPTVTSQAWTATFPDTGEGQGPEVQTLVKISPGPEDQSASSAGAPVVGAVVNSGAASNTVPVIIYNSSADAKSPRHVALQQEVTSQQHQEAETMSQRSTSSNGSLVNFDARIPSHDAGAAIVHPLALKISPDGQPIPRFSSDVNQEGKPYDVDTMSISSMTDPLLTPQTPHVGAHPPTTPPDAGPPVTAVPTPIRPDPHVAPRPRPVPKKAQSGQADVPGMSVPPLVPPTSSQTVPSLVNLEGGEAPAPPQPPPRNNKHSRAQSLDISSSAAAAGPPNIPPRVQNKEVKAGEADVVGDDITRGLDDTPTAAGAEEEGARAGLEGKILRARERLMGLQRQQQELLQELAELAEQRARWQEKRAATAGRGDGGV